MRAEYSKLVGTSAYVNGLRSVVNITVSSLHRKAVLVDPDDFEALLQRFQYLVENFAILQVVREERFGPRSKKLFKDEEKPLNVDKLCYCQQIVDKAEQYNGKIFGPVPDHDVAGVGEVCATRRLVMTVASLGFQPPSTSTFPAINHLGAVNSPGSWPCCTFSRPVN